LILLEHTFENPVNKTVNFVVTQIAGGIGDDAKSCALSNVENWREQRA